VKIVKEESVNGELVVTIDMKKEFRQMLSRSDSFLKALS